MRWRVFLEGAGGAGLLVFPLVYTYVLPGHLGDIYHQYLPSHTASGGILLGSCLIWLLFSAFLWVLDKSDRTHEGWFYVPAISLLFWKLAAEIFFLFEQQDLSWSYQRYITKLIFFSSIVIFFFLWRASNLWRLQITSFLRDSLAMLGFSFFWIAAVLLQSTFAYQADDSCFLKATEPAIVKEKPNRIVWILMDELSYDQVFDHRQPDIELPALDQLRQESVRFSNLQPAGYYTDQVIPSLFLGREIKNIRSSLSGEPSFFFSDTGRWEKFDEKNSLFAEAKRYGWSTGIAGWHNPYCRIFPNLIDYCFWMPTYAENLSGEQSTLANARWFLGELILPLRFMGTRVNPDDELSQKHLDSEKEIFPHAASLISMQAVQFAFVHLPLPHPPPVYNRHSHEFGHGGSYVDNLAFADGELGKLLKILRQTPSMQKTIIIISSDHSWRVSMWRQRTFWTAEDERISKGKYDPRPVLLIHFPGQEQEELVLQKFPQLALHTLIQEMLQGKMQSRKDFDAWWHNSQ